MRGIAKAAFGALALMALGHPAQAQSFDLNGAWTTNDTVCDKVFARSGNRVVLAQDSDMHGSGFVIDGNQIRGKVLTCNIRQRKEEGGVIHVVASCSNDVALEMMQFSAKPDGPNKLIRMFPHLPELNTNYYRCDVKDAPR